MITDETLKSSADKLIALASIAPKSDLKERVMSEYTLKLSTELKRILEEEKNAGAQIRQMLEKNWDFIKCNCLSYTATPHSGITKLLFESACYALSLDGNESPTLDDIIQLMMPGLPDLLTYKDTLPVFFPAQKQAALASLSEAGIEDPAHDEIINKMIVILTETDTFKDGLPVYHYPAGPGEQQQKDEKGDYAEFVKFLDSHIMSDNGKIIVPVMLLYRLGSTSESDDPTVIPSIYYEGDDGYEKSKFQLSDSELRRLSTHSNEARALHAARLSFDSAANDQGNLLGNLRLLVRMMRANSINGVGQEEKAADGGEAAMQSFWSYYEKLTPEDKERIPKEVADEITMIRKCLGKYEPGEDKIEIIATCLATRSDRMEYAITGHEETLSEISLGADVTSALVKETKDALDKALDVFVRGVKSPEYEGLDTLGVTKKLVQNLQIEVQFEDFQSVVDFLSPMSADEIISFLDNDEKLKEQLFQKIDSLENFMILTTVLSHDQLAALTAQLKTQLLRILGDISEFSIFLSSLTIQKTEIIVQNFPDLSSKLNTWKSISDLFKHLTDDQRTIVIDCHKMAIRRALVHTDGIVDLLDNLNEDQATILIDLIKDRLPSIIGNLDGIGQVADMEEQDHARIILAALEEQLVSNFESNSDISYLLGLITEEQRADILKKVAEGFDILARDDEYREELLEEEGDSTDLSDTIRFLGEEPYSLIRDAMKGNIVSIINTSNVFSYVAKHASESERTAICLALDKELSGILHSVTDLYNVLRNLPEEQQHEVFMAQIESFSDLELTDAHELKLALSIMDDEQASIFIEQMHDQILSVINTPFDLMIAMKALDWETVNILCESIKTHIAQTVSNIHDVKLLFEMRDGQIRDFILPDTIPRLPVLINSLDDYIEIAKLLTREELELLTDTLTNKVPDLVKNSYDLDRVFSVLSNAQCSILFDSLKNRLSTLSIDSSQQFIKILARLNDRRKDIALDACKDSWPKSIASVSELTDLLEMVAEENCDVAIEAVFPYLPNLIHNRSDLLDLFYELAGADHFSAVCELVELPSIICNVQDLRDMSIIQLSSVIEELQSRLPELIESKHELANLLTCFSKDQRTVEFYDIQDQLSLTKPVNNSDKQLSYSLLKMATAHKETLSDLFRNSAELVCMLELLTDHDLDAMFNTVLGDELPTIIQELQDLTHLLANIDEKKHYMVLDLLDKDDLSFFITTAQDVDNIFKHLNKDHHNVVFDAFKERLSEIIVTAQDFITVFKHLNADQRRIVFDDLELADLIKTGQDFEFIFKLLNEEQSNALYQEIESKLATLTIECWSEITTMLYSLDDDQAVVLFRAQKERIPSLITSHKELLELIEWNLNDESRGIILKEVLFDALPSIIGDNPVHLRDVLEQLSPDECKIVCDAIELTNLVHNAEDLVTVCSYLQASQQRVVLKSLEGKISSIIKSPTELNTVLDSLSVTEQDIVLKDLQSTLSSVEITSMLVGLKDKYKDKLHPIEQDNAGVVIDLVADISEPGTQAYNDFRQRPFDQFLSEFIPHTSSAGLKVDLDALEQTAKDSHDGDYNAMIEALVQQSAASSFSCEFTGSPGLVDYATALSSKNQPDYPAGGSPSISAR